MTSPVLYEDWPSPKPDRPSADVLEPVVPRERRSVGCRLERIFSAWTDEELLLAYRSKGDCQAYAELHERYRRELYAYLRKYLGNAALAEDALQQAFLQMHLKCDTFDSGRKVRPWLYTIATNQAIDLQRKQRRHQVASLDKSRYLPDGQADDSKGVLADVVLVDPGAAPPIAWR